MRAEVKGQSSHQGLRAQVVWSVVCTRAGGNGTVGQKGGDRRAAAGSAGKGMLGWDHCTRPLAWDRVRLQVSVHGAVTN